MYHDSRAKFSVCKHDLLLSLSGTKLSAVYQAAVDLVKAEKPAYVEKMTKSVGSVLSLIYTYKHVPRWFLCNFTQCA